MIGSRRTIPLRTILENCLTHIDKLEATRSVSDQYEKEFQDLKQFSENLKTQREYACTEGEKEINRKKNRYKDILPFNISRVVLAEVAGHVGSNYVNANYIKGASGSPAYIASQGPLPNTVNDFWRMIVECEVQVIIMACNAEEAGKHKCENYWVEREGEERTFGKVEIKLIKANLICPDFLVRTMRLKYTNDKGVSEERTVCQFHYSAWPDHGVPPLVRPLLDMVRLVRDTQASETLPVLVHCSAGCGRTGTICAIDFVWGLLRLGKLPTEFSLYNLVRDMRKQRVAMVQTKEQYILVHQAVRELFKEQLQIIDSHHYENLTPKGEPLLQESAEPVYETLLTVNHFSDEKQDRSKVEVMDMSTIEFCRKNAPPLPKKKCPSTPSSKQEKEVENLTEKNRTASSQKAATYDGPSLDNSLNRKPKIAKLKALFERGTSNLDRSGSKTKSHTVSRSHSLGPVRKPTLTEVFKPPEVKPVKPEPPIQSGGKLKVPKLITATSVYTRPVPHVKRSKSLKVTKEITPLLTLLQYASTDDLIDDRHQFSRDDPLTKNLQSHSGTSKDVHRKLSLTELEVLKHREQVKDSQGNQVLTDRIVVGRSAEPSKDTQKTERQPVGKSADPTWETMRNPVGNERHMLTRVVEQKKEAQKSERHNSGRSGEPPKEVLRNHVERHNLGRNVEPPKELQRNQVERQTLGRAAEPPKGMLRSLLNERGTAGRSAEPSKDSQRADRQNLGKNTDSLTELQRKQASERQPHPNYGPAPVDVHRQQSMKERNVRNSEPQKQVDRAQLMMEREKFEQSRRRRSLDSLIGEELPQITWPNTVIGRNRKLERQEVPAATKPKVGLSLKHQFQLLSHASQRTMNSLASGLGIRERRNSFRQAVSKEDSLDRVGAQFGTEGRFVAVPEDSTSTVFVDGSRKPYRETLTVRTQNGEILKPNRESQHQDYQRSYELVHQTDRYPVHKMGASSEERTQTRRHPLTDGKDAKISSQSMRLPSKNRFLNRLKTELHNSQHSSGNTVTPNSTPPDFKQPNKQSPGSKEKLPKSDIDTTDGQVQVPHASAWRDRGHYLLGIRSFKQSSNQGQTTKTLERGKKPLSRASAIDPQIAEYIALKDARSLKPEVKNFQPPAIPKQRSVHPYLTSDDLYATNHLRVGNNGPQFSRVGKTSSASSQSSDNLSDYHKKSPMLVDTGEPWIGKDRPRPTEISRLTGERLKQDLSSESSSSSGARELYSVLHRRAYEAETQRAEVTWSAVSRSKSTSQAFEELSREEPVAPPRVRRRSSVRAGDIVSRHSSLEPLDPQIAGWTLTKTQSSADARGWSDAGGVDLDAVAASMQRTRDPYPAAGVEPSIPSQTSAAHPNLRKQQYL